MNGSTKIRHWCVAIAMAGSLTVQSSTTVSGFSFLVSRSHPISSTRNERRETRNVLWGSQALSPDLEFVRHPTNGYKIRHEISEDLIAVAHLAASQKTYDNPDNGRLYEEALKAKGIRGSFGVETAPSVNYLPAQALQKAGFTRIFRIDNGAHRGIELGLKDNGTIVTQRGDATDLQIPSNSVDVVLHNQDLFWIHHYARSSSISEKSLASQKLIDDIELRNLAVLAALRETYRILKPAQWTMIKPGTYSASFDYRDREVALILPMLQYLGFIDLDVLSIKGTRLTYGEVESLKGRLTPKLAQKMFDWSFEHALEVFTEREIPVFIYARKPADLVEPPKGPLPGPGGSA